MEAVRRGDEGWGARDVIWRRLGEGTWVGERGTGHGGGDPPGARPNYAPTGNTLNMHVEGIHEGMFLC